MMKHIRRKALAYLTINALAVSILAPAAYSSPVQAAGPVQAQAAAPAQAAVDAAPVTANWYTTYQEMDGVGAAYAYTPSIHMMQLASAGHQDTVRRLLDLTFDEKNGTGHDIARVIIGDNGGLTASGTAASPGFNPVTSLLADVTKPGFDIEGNPIPMRGTAGQYGYKIEAENRYNDGNTDSIWPNEPAHDPGTLVPLEDFIWEYPSWNQPIPNDLGGPTNLLSAAGADPVIIKDTARTRKELFDFDQVWTMKQAMQYGVDQFYACVWTVPYWMSNSASNAPSKIIRNDVAVIDGKEVKIYYQAFADYLVYYIKGMWEQWGIPITHIGPFNEVDLAGANAAYVTEIVNEYIGPALKASIEPGGALYDIENPDGDLIDFIPQLVAVDGTNLNASISRGGQMFSQVDEATATMKNPYLDVFSTHLYGTVGIGTDENKLYHTGGFSQTPMDYTTAGNTYPQYLTKYKLWQTEFMNQDTGDGSAGAYTNRYGNQNINDAVRWSNLMTNMFTSNPGFNGFIWWSMWDNNGVDGSDLIRFVTTNSQQEPGRISTLTGEYRMFKRFYGYGHFSRFMNKGDKRFDVTRSPVQDINIVGFRSNRDFSITVSNAKNDDSIQPLEFTLNQFPVGTSSVTVFRTSGSENQQKLGTIPVVNGKFVIDIPSASIVTIVPSEGTYATFNSLDGERDIFSTLEAEGNDNGIQGDTAGKAGRANEAVTLRNDGYLAYRNVNFADGSANGGVVRRHLLYLTAQAKAAKGGNLVAYVLPVGTEVGDGEEIRALGREVARISVPANDGYGQYQDRMETGDLSAYGHKDLYIVAETSGGSSIVVDRFLFGANDSDWSTAANNSTVSIPGNVLRNGDFDTATASNTNDWSAGRYDNGAFQQAVTGPALTADTIQSYSGLSRYLKNNATSRVAGSAKLSGRIDAPNQFDGFWQDVTGKLTAGESYDFKGYFMSMKHRPESYDVAAENPGDVEVALVYYDSEGRQLALTPISGRDLPEPYQAREAGDPGYWNSNGQFVGRILEGGPLSLTSFQPVHVKVADWHESDSESFVYSEPAGTHKVVLAVYAKDSNIMYADMLSLTPSLQATYHIFVDGGLPANYSQDKFDYTHTVTGQTVPVVTASSNDPKVKVSISQARSASDTAIIRFIKDQSVKTYTVAFSTTEILNFADGLPTGWTIANPNGNALSFNPTGSVTLNAVKQDAAYPNSSNLLQFPGSAEGDWTLTARLSVNKALSDAAFTNASQVGLGISKAATGEFFRLAATRLDNSVKVISTGLSGTTTSTNQTGQTSLSGTNYYLRIVKSGNDVQGYFSTNNGSSYTIMSGRPGATVPTTFTPEFFKDAKVQLYGTNLSASDLQVTYNDVTLIKSAGSTAVGPDQLAVEQAAELIGTSITVPDADPADTEALRAQAVQLLNENEELAALGVRFAISHQDGQFELRITKGTAELTVRSLTIKGNEPVHIIADFEDQTAQGFTPRGGAQVAAAPSNEANHTPGGSYSLKVTGRNTNSDGAAIQVKEAVKIGREYKAEAWVKLISPASAQLKLTALVNAPTPYFISLQTQTVSNAGDWVKLEGTYRYLHDDVTLFVESPNSATASFYLDDFSFEDTGAAATVPIKEVYKNDFKIGNVPGNNDLTAGNRFNALFDYHFNSVTFGNEMKPDALQKNKGTFTFNTSDSMVSRAQSMGMEVHGHVLVWHSQSPAWFTQKVDAAGAVQRDEAGNPIYLGREEALANMRTHIKTVMEHFGDKVVSWDVVNEAMQDGPPAVADWKDALRRSPWYYSVGPDFVEQAFLAARDVLNEHPEWKEIKLYYNDFNDEFPAKRDAIHDMIKEMNDRYAVAHPGQLLVDGIGLQAHYNMTTKPEDVEAAIEKYASLGVELSISEIDVLAGMNSSLSAEWAEKQANLYAQLFRIYKKHADKIARVTIWGYMDNASWRASQNPLPFNSALAPKPAYYAIIDPDKYLDGKPLYAPPATKSTTALYGSPTIDGAVDDIWDDAPEIPVSNHLMATAGASGIAKMLWDEQNLYVLFEVSDTQLSRANTNRANQDSVVVYVDEDRVDAWPYREDDGLYRVNFANEQSFKFLSNSTPATSAGFESATSVSDANYKVEMKIPFKSIAPQNGTEIRVDAQVNDATGTTLQSVATWNDILGRAISSTEVFGQLTLTGKPDADNEAPTWPEGSALVESDVSSEGLTLTWSAAEDDVAVAGYKIYNGAEVVAVVDGSIRSYKATGLTAETAYTFKVEAGDEAGNWSTDGPSKAVTTKPLPDASAPTWPEDSTLAASNVMTTSLTLAWSAAQDNTGVTGYKIYQGTDEVAVVSGTVATYEVIGLTPETEYAFKIEARDEAGNWSTTGPALTVKTLPSADTTAPTWPEGSTLAASDLGAAGLTLTWQAAEDESEVTAYKIFQGTEQIALVAGTVRTYNVTGLTPNTEYTFKVEAGDSGGNWTESGPSATVRTLLEADATAPAWGEASALTPSSVTATALTLTWTAATDLSGVTGYKIYNGEVEIATVAGQVRSLQVTGLSPNSAYTFTVQAGDEAGNWSEDGPSVRVVTSSVSTPPPSTPAPTSTPTPTATVAPTSTPTATVAPTPTSSPQPTLAPHSFQDVGGKYAWASDAIDKLYANGVIKGTSATTFSPEKNITRADFVVLLVRALGLQAGSESVEGFDDVSPNDYYYEALLVARQLGIVNGVGGGSFNPKGEISRQDMMVIVARALKHVDQLPTEGAAEDLNNFSDASNVADYAQDSVAALIKEGIIKGDGLSLHPTGKTTRAQAAVVIAKIFGK